MTTRALYGETFVPFEITLDIGHSPKQLTKAIRAILEEEWPCLLRSVDIQPGDEDNLVYIVVVAEL